ncbi:MAG: hypothetical protein JNK22_13980 [Rhodocyclaceae bacterium]|nr:hypothetical protein [Rhodocyclaceae bacterium]
MSSYHHGTVHSRAWRTLLESTPPGGPPGARDLPEAPVEDLAALALDAVLAGARLKIVLPDDEWLGPLSQALDLAIRPLCLLLPDADFAAGIAARATLSLLRSRLARDAEEPAPLAAAWQGARLRLEARADDWARCQAWAAHGRGDDWPAVLGGLFPVLAMGPRRAMQDGSAADWLVLAAADAWPAGESARRLILRPPGPRTAPPRAVGREQRLRLELEALSREVGELELELATVQGEMAPFSQRYYEVVGSRLVELDALQAKLALRAAERADRQDFSREAGTAPGTGDARRAADEARGRAERSQEEYRRFQETRDEAAGAAPFRPAADLKRLFRRIAQRIHPDRARDDDDRAWRTQLMAEANRAYRRGDRAALEEVLALWQEGRRGSGPAGPDDAGEGTVLEAQVMRLRSRLATLQRELEAVFASRLYELFQAQRVAARQGRDLLAEMAVRLDGEIAEIRQRLETLAD